MSGGRRRGPRERGGAADVAAVWLANRCGWQISEAERQRQADLVRQWQGRVSGEDWPMWRFVAVGLFWRWLEWPGCVLANAEGRLRRWWQGD